MRSTETPQLLAILAVSVLAALMLRVDPDVVLGTNMTSVPATVSPEARDMLAREFSPAKRRANVFPSAEGLAALHRERERELADGPPASHPVIAAFAPTLMRKIVAGVPALEIMPARVRDRAKTIVYLHGGGYVLGSASQSLDVAVPLADATGYRVLAVDYTKAPSKDWRGIGAEVVGVMKGLLGEGSRPADIALFGDSAGGALAASAILRMREEGVPMPAVLLAWSPWADIEPTGDTYTTLADADPFMRFELVLAQAAAAYAPDAQV